MIWILLSTALAAGGGWWLEGPEMAERADAVALQSSAERGGYHARVVKRFHLGEGWEFVTLIEGFGDEEAAAAAAKKLTKDGLKLTLVHDPAKGGATRVAVAAPPPAVSATDSSAVLAAARAVNGGPTGGVSALARASAVHFVFEREFELDGKRVTIAHDYWRDATSRRLKVETHGSGTDSTSIATAGGAWIKVGGKVESRDIGVLITQADAFAPETVLGVALDVDALFATGDALPLLLLEGAESGVRVGRGEDPTEPGLAFADVDPTTGYLLRVRYVTEGGPVSFVLGDWRVIAPSLAAPGSLAVERADGRMEVIRVQRLELVDGAPPGTFSAPQNDAGGP